MNKGAVALGFGVALGALAITFSIPVALQAQRARTPNASANMCSASEQPLFQCRLGSKQVALCAGVGAGAGAGADAQRYVQYRYGRPGRIELAFPERGTGGLSWARTGYSGGGELQVNAQRGDTRYVLYSQVVRTRFDGQSNEPRFSAGLAVIRGNRILSDRECSDTDQGWSREADVERLLLEGAFTAWWDLQEGPRR